jgi:ABC-type antimicrobial peptide transport system permease subunit
MHFTAAAGGMGLVVLGVGVGLYFTQRRREFEFASLRAMGSRPRQVTSVLVAEQGLLVGFAVAAGAGLGFAILRLMMPYLGKSLGVAFPAPILTLDWTSLGLYGIAVAAATGLGLVLAVRALLMSSVTSVLRGEAE